MELNRLNLLLLLPHTSHLIRPRVLDSQTLIRKRPNCYLSNVYLSQMTAGTACAEVEKVLMDHPRASDLKAVLFDATSKTSSTTDLAVKYARYASTILDAGKSERNKCSQLLDIWFRATDPPVLETALYHAALPRRPSLESLRVATLTRATLKTRV